AATLLPLSDPAAPKRWVESRLRPGPSVEVTPSPVVSATLAAPVAAPTEPRSPRGLSATVPAKSAHSASASDDAGLRRSGSSPLDEAPLARPAPRLATLPEPLAVLATHVEAARAEGDSTGVRKRLFELGAGAVRYAVSAGLSVLRKRLADQGQKAPAA